MNIVVIVADQLSAKWLGAYGDPAARTPCLDALAARGRRFDCCCANQPVCMPSRAAAITGRSPQFHGVYYNGFELGTDLPTYPQVLRDAGYQTFGIGKFHLECHGRSDRNDVTKYGFDRAETTEDIRCGEWLDWVEQHHPEAYDRALSTVWHGGYLPEYGSPERRHRIAAAKEAFPPQTATFGTWPCIVPEEATQTAWVASRAIDFVRERDPARPFFLQMSFVGPHNPYEPPARFLDLIDPARIRPPVASEDPAIRAFVRRCHDRIPIDRHFGASDWPVARHYYHAFMAFIDSQIGRVLDFLAAEGLADDTAILFTADHGDMLGDHDCHTKGAWHFDACIRVPMLLYVPGHAPAVVPRAVSNLDLFPTLLELAGSAAAVPLEGTSLLAVDPDRPNAVLVETYASYAVHDPDLHAWTARTPTAAYTRFGDGSTLLFDLTTDPDETRNLAGRPTARALEAELRDLLTTLAMRRYVPLANRGHHPTALH